MSPPLSWSLVVSTYARHDMLALCVRMAVRQSRRPLEVVVIDGSENWEAGRTRLAGELAAAGFGGRLLYQPAAVRGLTRQRNQGIGAASGDVLFLLDDDSLMYEDCAERVMEVYDADPEERVAGVGLVHVPAPPPPARGLVPGDPPVVGLRARLDRRLTELSWRGSGYFLPYDRVFPTPPVPAGCAALGTVVSPVLDGFRMTFRRRVCETLRFEEMLQHSATYGEDHDFCYRALALGAVVELPPARVHHAVAEGGRLSPRTVTTMLWCNRVALQAVNGTARGRAARRLLATLPFHLALAVLRDVVKGDAGLPRTRGLLEALPSCSRLLVLPGAQVRESYPAMQARLFGGHRGARGRSLGIPA